MITTVTLVAALAMPGAAGAAIQEARPGSERPGPERPGSEQPSSPVLGEVERLRERERELLERIALLESELRAERSRSLARQEEWISFTRLLQGFEIPALPAPPEFVATALVAPRDPAAEALERAEAALRVRGAQVEASLRTLLRAESVRGFDLLEVGLLHEHEGRSWTGPVIARLIDERGRMVGIYIFEHQMRRHTHLNRIELTKGFKIMSLQAATFHKHAWQIQMRIQSGPSVARNMFQNAQYSPMPQALMQRARMENNRGNCAAITAIFQNSMGVRLRNIAQWRAIAINPAAAQILRDQPAPQPKQPLGLRCGGLIQRWRKLEPMRRTKPRHAPALLVDHNGRMPANGGAQICAKLANLRRGLKIS